jgi:hypothetical protein
MTINIKPNIPIPTTPTPRPYRVRLEGGPIDLGGEIVTVHDDVIIGECRVVRSAHGEGFWCLPADIPLGGPHSAACRDLRATQSRDLHGASALTTKRRGDIQGLGSSASRWRGGRGRAE